jgi:hypothetical protein
LCFGGKGIRRRVRACLASGFGAAYILGKP